TGHPRIRDQAARFPNSGLPSLSIARVVKGGFSSCAELALHAHSLSRFYDAQIDPAELARHDFPGPSWCRRGGNADRMGLATIPRLLRRIARCEGRLQERNRRSAGWTTR